MTAAAEECCLYVCQNAVAVPCILASFALLLGYNNCVRVTCMLS